MVPILRRKLVPPPSWPEAIARPRVESLLDAAIAAEQHIVVAAGAGYGKTHLLSEWCRKRAAAWLTLDAEDADPEVFLSYIVHACEHTLAGFKTEARMLLPRAREREGALATLSVLIADLDEQCDRPLVIILDDYHLAESPSLDELLRRCFKYLPPMVRLVLCTRRLPDIALSALQVKRQVTLLGEPELAFDERELARLHPNLDSGRLVKLLETTGGWPAGMGMPPDMLESYLEDHFLADLPATLRSFLLRASLVETFDRSFCAHALSETLTPSLLDTLIRYRLIVGMEADRFAIRQPLRGMLRRQFLAESEPSERRSVLRRIGDHLWQTGQAPTALQIWIEAQETIYAAEHLLTVAEDWLRENRLDTLAHVLNALGNVTDFPELLLVQGDINRRWGNFDLAEELFERAFKEFEQRSNAQGCAVVGLRKAMLAAGRGKVELAHQWLESSVPSLASGDRLHVDVFNLRGGLSMLTGESRLAIQHFEDSLQLSRRLADRFSEARALHNLGVCFTALGEFFKALECYEASLGLATKDGLPATWMTPINRALVLVYLDRPNDAIVAAEQALNLVRRYGLTREEGYALRTMGYAHTQLGSLERAEACFDSAELLARRTNDQLGIAYSLNSKAELAVSRGDSEMAMQLIDACADAAGGFETVSRNPEFAVVRAKVLLANGRSGDAETLLGALEEMARRTGNKRLLDDVRKVVQGKSPTDTTTSVQQESVPELEIECFGGMRTRRHGQEIGEREWQSVQAKLLLAYLLHYPQGATKATLFEALYPEDEVSDASMRMNFSRLRKALEPELDKGQASRYLLRADGRYSFNRQTSFQLDTLTFENVIRQAERSTGCEREAMLRTALRLYQGDFLPEFEHGWVQALRQRFRERALGACRMLLELSDSTAAPEIVHRALEIEPLSPEFNRELILRYLEAEEPHRALEHYRLCERRFRESMGVQPPADLAELIKNI